MESGPSLGGVADKAALTPKLLRLGKFGEDSRNRSRTHSKDPLFKSMSSTLLTVLVLSFVFSFSGDSLFCSSLPTNPSSSSSEIIVLILRCQRPLRGMLSAGVAVALLDRFCLPSDSHMSLHCCRFVRVGCGDLPGNFSDSRIWWIFSSCKSLFLRLLNTLLRIRVWQLPSRMLIRFQLLMCVLMFQSPIVAHFFVLCAR